MKKQFLAICVLSAVMLSSCSSVDNTSADEVQTTASENVIYYEGKAFLRDELSSETIEWLEQYNSLSEESKQVINYIPYELLPKESFSVFETETEISIETITEETESTELEAETETEASVGETDTEIVNRIKSIDNSAYDKYSFIRKYDAKVENIYIVGEIIGQDVLQEWVDNVFLKKSDEEMNKFPAIYQAIVELGISEEDFRKKNEEYIDYPGMYYPEEMISALYSDDINAMKRQLTDPWALYYDGEVYAFDEMYADPNIVAGVPADVMNEYLDFIEAIDGVKVRNIN
ncbi:MAG: hypothetical protein HDT25_03825 [Ruminococcus sp.]|nr:hypothetical protein [Ruminococcus sp.]